MDVCRKAIVEMLLLLKDPLKSTFSCLKLPFSVLCDSRSSARAAVCTVPLCTSRCRVLGSCFIQAQECPSMVIVSLISPRAKMEYIYHIHRHTFYIMLEACGSSSCSDSLLREATRESPCLSQNHPLPLFSVLPYFKSWEKNSPWPSLSPVTVLGKVSSLLLDLVWQIDF